MWKKLRKRFDYTFGWSATSEAVEPWVYEEVHRIYVADDAAPRQKCAACEPAQLRRPSSNDLPKPTGGASGRPSDEERREQLDEAP